MVRWTLFLAVKNMCLYVLPSWLWRTCVSTKVLISCAHCGTFAVRWTLFFWLMGCLCFSYGHFCQLLCWQKTSLLEANEQLASLEAALPFNSKMLNTPPAEVTSTLFSGTKQPVTACRGGHSKVKGLYDKTSNSMLLYVSLPNCGTPCIGCLDKELQGEHCLATTIANEKQIEDTSWWQ